MARFAGLYLQLVLWFPLSGDCFFDLIDGSFSSSSLSNPFQDRAKGF